MVTKSTEIKPKIREIRVTTEVEVNGRAFTPVSIVEDLAGSDAYIHISRAIGMGAFNSLKIVAAKLDVDLNVCQAIFVKAFCECAGIPEEVEDEVGSSV
jgi:hypothetical protein